MYNFNKIVTNTYVNIDSNTIKKHVIIPRKKYERSCYNLFCSIKNSGKVKEKFKALRPDCLRMIFSTLNITYTIYIMRPFCGT